METVLKDSYYCSLCLCVYVEKKKCSWSICLSSICMVIICFSQKFAKGGVCWVFDDWLHFWKNKLCARCAIRCLRHCVEHWNGSGGALITNAIYGMLVSLSWILHGAFYKVLYKEGCLMLQILFKNISEEYLFEEHIFRESHLINME